MNLYEGYGEIGGSGSAKMTIFALLGCLEMSESFLVKVI